MYKGEVIHIIGGLNDYIGELDQSEHPNGPGWYRINKPVLSFLQQDDKGRPVNALFAYKGAPGEQTYRDYVDIFIPPDDPKEIRTLVKDGPSHKIYMKIVNAKKSIIHLPNQGKGVITH
jgi:hypothetical protein